MRNTNPNRSPLAKMRLAALVAAAMLIDLAPAVAGEQIYSFVDERGVEHFSNVPSDPRYKVVGWLKPQATGRSAQQPQNPAVPPAAYNALVLPEPDMNEVEEMPMSQYQEPPLARKPMLVDPRELEQQAHVPPVSVLVVDMPGDPAIIPERIGGDPAFAMPPPAEPAR